MARFALPALAQRLAARRLLDGEVPLAHRLHAREGLSVWRYRLARSLPLRVLLTV